MMHPSIRVRVSALLAVPVLAFTLTACGGHYRPDQSSSQLAFGVDMAKHGLWSEALFRFREAERLDPNNPRVANNLGVAYEAAGDYDKALDLYKKALKLDPNNKDLRANYARFVEFYQGFKPGEKTAQGGAAKPAASPQPAAAQRPPDDNTPPPAPAPAGTPEPTAPAGPPPPFQ